MPTTKPSNTVWTAPKLTRLAANLAEGAGTNPGDGGAALKS